VNPSGVLIHAVSDSKADAVDNRFVRFKYVTGYQSAS
jgi:hypothetical protein